MLIPLLNDLFVFFSVPETIDQEKKMKHSKWADRLEEVIQDPSKISVKLKVFLQLKKHMKSCIIPCFILLINKICVFCAQADFVDVAYRPIIQSGGEYDYKLSGTSNDKAMHYGVILCQVGAR